MKTLKINLLFLVIFLSKFTMAGPPDEGMWLPLLLKDYNYAEMQRLGLKLTPEQIYSVNNSSLKDAIVQLGGFCTAEVISNEGLILTNHHCAYDAIASSSTEENNYLKNGFWAMDKNQEIPIEGLSVTFLVRMEDVTEDIMNKMNSMEPSERDMAAYEEMNRIETELSEGGKYTVEIKEMFDGNAYYVFVYETYTDIRLVGAPPSSVGKFGGDTDNWMWPRHTGDFSLLRIYSGTDNKPSPYDQTNLPLTPKHFLPVSTKGVSEGDFTMVMGYPGSTNRYLTSPELKNQQESENPIFTKLLGKRLEIMKTEMDKSEAVHLAHASDYASLANSYKYYKGQTRSLQKFDLIAQKRKYEAELMKWVEADESRSLYSNMLTDIEKAFAESGNITNDAAVINFAGFSPSFISTGIAVWRYKRTLSKESVTQEEIDEGVESLREKTNGHFETYNREMDRNMLSWAINSMKNDMSSNNMMTLFKDPLYVKKAKGSPERYADITFEKSILMNEALFNKFLDNPSLKKLEKDPGIIYITSLIDLFRAGIQGPQAKLQVSINEARELYMQAIRKKEKKNFYPDANFTMRLTYGTVGAYKSWDGKPYNTFTYGSEILDKYKAGDEEFDVPEKLRTLLKSKDYGSYTDENGKLPVCFLHNTDITGGNSGSPVINANGELVGVAFDGNWESMASDLFWQDEYVRTISVDVRYLLFIIDKYGGASHLIDEMKLVK